MSSGNRQRQRGRSRNGELGRAGGQRAVAAASGTEILPRDSWEP